MRAYCTLLFSFACLLAGGVVHAQAGDPYHVQLYASVDRSVVAVGDEITYAVELLAVPDTEADAAVLRSALLEAELSGSGFEVTDTEALETSEVEGVLELTRTFQLRALTASRFEVGPLVLNAPSLPEARSPAFEVIGYRQSPRLETAAHSVVSLDVDLGGGARRIGSGFVVDADAIVTAYHVIAGAMRVDVRFPNGHRTRLENIVSLDPERDVALLHISPEEVQEGHASPLPRAPVPDGGRVSFTAGWPKQDQVETAGTRFSDVEIETGTVWVSDNPVEPGDSGGPLFDEAGRVLGVVVSGRPVPGAPDVLRETVAIATDLRPAMRARWERPRSLRQALRDAAARWPSARTLEAVTAFQIRRDGVSDKREALSTISKELGAAPLIQYLGGLVLDVAGHGQPARRAFSRAESYFPAQYALAHHYLQAGDYDRAVPLFEALLDQKPFRHLGAFGLARARVGQHRYAEARAALDVVLAHDSRFAPAVYLRGLLFVESGEPVKAAALAARLRAQPGWSNRLRLAIENEAMGLPPAVRRPWAVLAAR